MISFTSTPVAVNAARLKNNPHFGCRFEIIAADKELPQSTMALLTPGETRATVPDGEQTHNHPYGLQPNQKLTIAPRVNTVSEWLWHRDPRIRHGSDDVKQAFFGPFTSKAWREDLLQGAIPGPIPGMVQPNARKNANDHSMPVAIIHPTSMSDPKSEFQVHENPDIYNDGASDPAMKNLYQLSAEARRNRVEEMQKRFSEISQQAINQKASAEIVHARFATKGEATHHFEAMIDGVHIGFLHNGTVAGVLEKPALVAKINTLTPFTNPSADPKQHASLIDPYAAGLRQHGPYQANRIYLDPNDQIALHSDNDSYRYFLLILANLLELSGGTLNEESFKSEKLNTVIQAVAQTGLEARDASKAANHPGQGNKTSYSKVGYAGVFYFTHPNGDSFIMALEGGKGVMEALYIDPATGQHILTVGSENSQDQKALIPQPGVRRPKASEWQLNPRYLNEFQVLPNDSGVVITKEAGQPQKASLPFTLKDAKEGRYRLQTMPLNELAQRQGLSPHPLRFDVTA